MGVYIKGIEMPKSCAGCFANCILRQYSWSFYRRPDNCPLVPVPPHGDLIERKAIGLTDFEIAMCNGNYKEGMKMLLEKIESTPTIISAEEE